LLPDLTLPEDGDLPPRFAGGLLDESLECVFGRAWTRPGLDWRSRSLVTLGILIALRAEDELRLHLAIALRNGLSREELEEVIYHAAAYAGFPAASTAGRIGHEVLD
jgi:4-carboxymuconolactone decarboxylase